MRNTRHDYLLRCLVSCRRCGLAHHVWTNGRYAYYRCRGADTLLNRVRPDPCRARQLPAADLDALVWTDLCAVLDEPRIVEEALRQAQQGWLHPDEQAARRADLVQRQRDLQRQIERLSDACTAGVLSLEELGARLRKLEGRLEALRREESHLAASARQTAQTRHVAEGIEHFRAQIARRLAHADFATKRAIVELVVDRVVVGAAEVEIRYVIPFTGAAQRKGVLRPHYRADHRSIKQRYYPMPGFGAFASAARFCTAHDELRDHFRYRQHTNETMSLAAQRRLFQERWDEVCAVPQAA